METLEGCATIFDNNGNLLFYTDGSTVWDKSHTVMLNGAVLLGHNSSIQSAIIVKKPCASSLYYIFTVDGYSGNYGGLNYSIVDMSLNGGLGDVNTNKNRPISPSACEKVTAIQHQNRTDFWIVSRLENSVIFHVYLLSSAGLNLTPVIGPAFSSLNEGRPIKRILRWK